MAGRILVYGFGNPGRQDDALGPVLADKLGALNIKGLDTDTNYQLNIEDADNIDPYEEVIFIDAAKTGPEPYSFTKLDAARKISFSTHSVSPASVLAIYHELYEREKSAYLLAVRGYSWEYEEQMTPRACSNQEKAFLFLKNRLIQALT